MTIRTDNSAVIARLTRERDEARAEAHEQARLLGMSAERELKLMAEVERLNTECDSLAHQLNRCNERGGEMRRLLVWAESLIRYLSGWPEHHSNEVVDWKEDWRKVREGE